MRTILKSALAASLMIGAAPSVVFAQAATGPVVPGLAVANLDAVIGNSNAYKTAQTQRPVTYKAQIDQAEARRKAIAAQLTPLVEKFTKDRQANVAAASLQTQATTIQQIQQSGEAELQRILQPVAYSEAYVNEQIEDRLDPALKSAMAAKKISLLLSPQAILAASNNAYNLNQDILNELNKSLPSAQLVPPAGWEPRQVREARAQQQGGAAAAAPAAPAGPQPQGR